MHGGGSARITGGATLNATPTLYQTNSSGQVALTYTAPASLLSSGIDSIVVQDLRSSPQITNKFTISSASGGVTIFTAAGIGTVLSS